MSRQSRLESALYWSGLAAAQDALAQDAGAVVLMYHSVCEAKNDRWIDPANRVSAATFEAQVAFLAKRGRVLSLTELVDSIGRGVSPKKGTVVLTFDDGYTDNLEVAAPILDRYKLPATLFLPTGYVERAENQWADVLFAALLRRTRHEVSVTELGRVDLRDDRAAAGARRVIHRKLLEGSYAERTELLRDVLEQLGVGDDGPRLTMGWDRVRELKAKFPRFEFGLHTRDHIDLRTHRGERARLEIRQSAQDFAKELGAPARFFSFPYGRWCAETRGMVETEGLRASVVSSDRLRITAGTDRYTIGRVVAPDSLSRLKVRSGAGYPGLMRWTGLA